MSRIEFLTIEEVVEINADQIALHGGLQGIRDVGILESAVMAAEFESCYGSDDLFDLAATYVGHIIQDHPFLDGKKRTGVKAGLVFLALNGQQLKLGARQLSHVEEMAVSIASGQAGKENMASLLRACMA